MLLWTYRLWVVLAFGKPSWALYSVMFLLFYEEDKESQKEMDTYWQWWSGRWQTLNELNALLAPAPKATPVPIVLLGKVSVWMFVRKLLFENMEILIWHGWCLLPTGSLLAFCVHCWIAWKIHLWEALSLSKCSVVWSDNVDQVASENFAPVLFFWTHWTSVKMSYSYSLFWLAGKECAGRYILIPWSNCVGWKNWNLQGMESLLQ
jgi:hypothetical protein